ncbi:MAG TPA: hypothetical protein VIZ30_02655 [Pseudomonadales bacterium]
MSAQDASLNDAEHLLTALNRLPADALQIVQAFVTELLQCIDDDERRKEVLSAATSKLSALRSV